MIRYALESFLVAWRHVPGYRELTSRRTPLMTLFFAQCPSISAFGLTTCHNPLSARGRGAACRASIARLAARGPPSARGFEPPIPAAQRNRSVPRAPVPRLRRSCRRVLRTNSHSECGTTR